MSEKNTRFGSSFESWLDEKGLRAEVTAAAVKSVIADQIAAAVKKLGLDGVTYDRVDEHEPSAVRPLTRSRKRRRDV